MLVHEFLETSAAILPEKTALICGTSRLNYRELDFLSNRIGNALERCGVVYGDRVAIVLDNSIEGVASIFGTLKANAIFVYINPSTKSDKLKYIFNNCRISSLITDRSKWVNVGIAAKETSSLKSIFFVGGMPEESSHIPSFDFENVVSAEQNNPPTRKAIDIDLAALIYTSGTTGFPKGVIVTHRNIVSASTSITEYLENTRDDIILNVLPLSFDYGLYQVIMSAQFGGTLVIEKTFIYPYAIINLLKNERVTGFPIVPTISAILLQLKNLENEEFENLRYITNTAAALPVSHIRSLQRIFKKAKIYSMYGLTECKRVSYLPPKELARRPTSVGKGMPNEQVYLVDENDRKIEEPGVTGELVVRGANVMKGYWELPEETAQMLRKGNYPWEKVLYTGDLFYKDEEGFLYFVSRKDDIIKSSGEKVSPKEVENVIYELPEVLEAAVIGVPDELLGEAIKAFIVLKNGVALTEKDIISHCAAHLEDFMVPKIVEFIDSMPKTDSGKITKKGLK